MTNKTKNIALLSGFAIALLICYKFAIANTIDARKEYDDLKKQEALFGNTPKQLSILRQKEKYYDAILEKYQLNEGSIQNNLLKTINSFSNTGNIKVVSFLEPHLYKKNDLLVKTYQFTLEGDYNSIIRGIHLLEQDTKFGEIINLSFEKKKNFRTGRHYLQASVLLKSFG